MIRWGRAARWLIALLLLATVAGGPAKAEHYDSRESALRVAFLYNFAKFTRWPPGRFPDADTPVTFCLLDDILHEPALQLLKGKTIEGRPLAVRNVSGSETLSGCHLLHASEHSAVKWNDLIHRSTQAGVLLVTDSPALPEMGGHIGLFPVDGKMRFKVNISSVRASGISLSSKLLNLALIVE